MCTHVPVKTNARCCPTRCQETCFFLFWSIQSAPWPITSAGSNRRKFLSSSYPSKASWSTPMPKSPSQVNNQPWGRAHVRALTLRHTATSSSTRKNNNNIIFDDVLHKMYGLKAKWSSHLFASSPKPIFWPVPDGWQQTTRRRAFRPIWNYRSLWPANPAGLIYRWNHRIAINPQNQIRNSRSLWRNNNGKLGFCFVSHF